MARSRVVNLANLEQFAAVNVLSDPGHIGGPIVIPNCTQVVLTWSQADGKQAHNVLYARSAGVPTPSVAQAQALFAAMTTGAAWTAIQAAISTTTALQRVTLTSVHTAGQPSFDSTGAAVAGTDATAPLPNEVAICITLRTAGRGPSNRGRMYIPGLCSDDLAAGNVILAGLLTNFGNWANGFIAIFSGQSLTWVVGNPARAAYTGITGTQHPARPAGSVPITAALVRDNHWDSQRRRGLK